MITIKQKVELIASLTKIDAIQHGTFTLKSGATSNIYFDMRRVYGYPQLLEYIVTLFQCIAPTTRSNLVCGVPLGGIPFATMYSCKENLPMILVRQEKKEHGTMKLIEGKYTQGDNVILIEDVITTGGSVLNTCRQLKNEGLVIDAILCIVDRRESFGFLDKSQVFSLLTMDDFQETNKPVRSTGLEQRTFYSPFSTRLWDIILTKKTNLCLSLDTENITMEQLTLIAPYICLLKIHFDLFSNNPCNLNHYYDWQHIEQLAEQYNFLILDDRKYADIGSIVCVQQKHCPIQGDCIASTVHSVFGQSTISGLSGDCFLIAQSSAKNNLIDEEYTCSTYRLGVENKVAGFIAQERFCKDEGFLYLTPGVSLTQTGDGLGQQYKTVEEAVCRDKVDIIVVGRGIYEAKLSSDTTSEARSVCVSTNGSEVKNPIESAKEYSELGWKCLEKRG